MSKVIILLFKAVVILVNAVVFDVEYTGSIYRDNLKNSTDYEMAKKITHKYCIGTSVNTCYDTVGEEYDV